MDKTSFIAAFDRAATFCRDFAQQFVIEELPTAFRFDFAAAGRAPNETGYIKFLGGRLLTAAQLRGVEPVQARKYLWVDGTIPVWINFMVHVADAEFTFIEIALSQRQLRTTPRFITNKKETRPSMCSARRCRLVGFPWRKAASSAWVGELQREDGYSWRRIKSRSGRIDERNRT